MCSLAEVQEVSTACCTLIPFQYVLKCVDYGQVKISGLLMDVDIAVRAHEELRLLDAKRHLVKSVQCFLSQLPEIHCCLFSIRSSYSNVVRKDIPRV